jgi:hypothetical protein
MGRIGETAAEKSEERLFVAREELGKGVGGTLGEGEHQFLAGRMISGRAPSG